MRLFDKPNLAFTLGHEATHLLVNKYVGYNWTKDPRAAEAIDAVKKLGGREEDIEESLCLFGDVTTGMWLYIESGQSLFPAK